jgi:formamidopyrimidine-DNA glycosylase
MPELPEVETIRQDLRKKILHKKIKNIEITQKTRVNMNHPDFVKALKNKEFVEIDRIGKLIIFGLANKKYLLVHLKMTGQLIYEGGKLQKSKTQKLSSKVIGGLGGKHTHLIFHLDDGDLYYNDVRQFGWVKVVKNEELEAIVFAPEPLKDLNIDHFTDLLSKSKRNIKVMLMDQSKIGGVGNIYANDALWLAKISPKRSSNSLTSQEATLLFKAIETVLKAGLKYGGASELAFVTPDGKEGEYQNHSLIYGHTDEICQSCKKNKVEKFFLGGRGTYWCKFCQK